jgi:nucleoside-diphosphate-sugar epimerase
MPSAKLIFGCGYLGHRVAQLWRCAGDRVFAVTRSAKRAEELGKQGLEPIVADVASFASMNSLPPTDAMLFAVGFDRAAGGDIHDVYAGGLHNVLAALPPTATRVVYISTTGVYGTGSGDWVDEQTPPDPQRDGGRASLAAERILAAHPLGRRSVILRLAGIYGPGRVPNLEPLRAGEPIAAPSAGWLNLIHVDDAARVVVEADRWQADQPEAHGPHLFCVSDGSPVIRGDYYAEAARLVGAPPPRFVDPPANSPATVRSRSSRRVRSDNVWRELGLTPRYASYREGLATILQE